MTDLNQLETVEPGADRASGADPQHACLTIAFHPDTRRVGEHVSLSGAPVALCRTEPSFRDGRGQVTGPLACLNVSRRPIRLLQEADALLLEAGAHGTHVRVDGDEFVGSRRFSREELAAGVVLELAHRVVLLLHLRAAVSPSPAPLGLVGESDALEGLRAQIVQVAERGAPVLLQGETGTGKELVARALHACGRGDRRPFVAVNLAAIPASVAASELFGHAAGAFTGAGTEHRGLFEQADGGTLFLDEVGAADPQLQGILLRVLDSGEFHPLGARASRRVDVRVVAATDTDLSEAVAAGRFRAPLFHRLTGHVLRIPPLRERRDDVGRLLIHFLRLRLAEVGASGRLDEPENGVAPWVPAELVARLVRAPWPGNVRELSNLAHRMVAGYHDLDAVDPAVFGGADSEAPDGEARPAAGPISEEHLVETMQACDFRIGAAARRLGISRNALYALLQRSPRLRRAKDLSAEEIACCRGTCGDNPEAMARNLQVSVRALKLRLRELGRP
ncbi:MAG: sigma-54-dependent Fis family transcriptional regulator [Deltaproteobacteria bacterium]|nr:sigma-54-dependent Fis family transcriptional regulator [Deltaproteobacteria bacterium]